MGTQEAKGAGKTVRCLNVALRRPQGTKGCPRDRTAGALG